MRFYKKKKSSSKKNYYESYQIVNSQVKKSKVQLEYARAYMWEYSCDSSANYFQNFRVSFSIFFNMWTVNSRGIIIWTQHKKNSYIYQTHSCWDSYLIINKHSYIKFDARDKFLPTLIMKKNFVVNHSHAKSEDKPPTLHSYF